MTLPQKDEFEKQSEKNITLKAQQQRTSKFVIFWTEFM